MCSANLPRHRGWFLYYNLYICAVIPVQAPCAASVCLATDVLGVSCCPAMWGCLCMQMDACARTARTAALGMHRVRTECIAPTVIIGEVDIADLHSNLFWSSAGDMEWGMTCCDLWLKLLAVILYRSRILYKVYSKKTLAWGRKVLHESTGFQELAFFPPSSYKKVIARDISSFWAFSFTKTAKAGFDSKWNCFLHSPIYGVAS